jgi:hypothetical protein
VYGCCSLERLTDRSPSRGVVALSSTGTPHESPDSAWNRVRHRVAVEPSVRALDGLDEPGAS